ncbi:hypothetical protein MOSE0_M07206 [Monosporozyma servazzii]
MPSTKHIKKKKSHVKTSKPKKKSSTHSKKHSKTRKKEISEKLDNSICLKCKNSSHVVSKCPKIWRAYILREDSHINDKLILPIHTIFCYRCGERGHLGDDCIKFESSKNSTFEASAFSGKNLEMPLSKIYYRNIKRQREDADSFEGKASFHRSHRTFHFYRPPYTKKALGE